MKSILALLLIFAPLANAADKYAPPPSPDVYRGQPVPMRPINGQMAQAGTTYKPPVIQPPQINPMPNLQPLGPLLTIDPRVFLPSGPALIRY